VKLYSSTIDLHQRASRTGKPFFHFLAALSAGFLDFLYPPECLICRKRLPGFSWICPECESDLQNALDVKSQSEAQDFIYLSEPFYFQQILSCWSYSPGIETLVHHVKYHKGWRLGIRLGEQMGQLVSKAVFPDADCLIPVPLHPVRQRERGYNQSFLYCKGFQRVHPIPIQQNNLIRIRQTGTQTQLDSEARQANVSRVFCVKNAKRIQGKRIVLVDDVVTTGATMNACAKALLDAGAGCVTGLALVRPDVRFKPGEIS
jgi:competence protein ComFC